MTPRVVVIGVGNPYRHDDAVGLHVLDAIRARLPIGVSVVETDGEPGRLIDAWGDADVAFVADAARAGGPPGTIHRIELGAQDPRRTKQPSVSSTHALGVAEALRLGRALGRAPHRLVVFGIEPADVSAGPGLSVPVEAAVAPAAARLADEVEALLGLRPVPDAPPTREDA